MFSKPTAPVVEPAHDDVGTVPTDPVPLSVLQLDLGEPPTGWASHLADRDIEIVLDDLGRLAIARDNARRLFAEERENEARRREVAARNEQRVVEADQRWRAQLPSGTPWYDIPVGVSAAQVWVQAEKDAKPKRRTPLEDALAGKGTVYRPLPDES